MPFRKQVKNFCFIIPLVMFCILNLFIILNMSLCGVYIVVSHLEDPERDGRGLDTFTENGMFWLYSWISTEGGNQGSLDAFMNCLWAFWKHLLDTVGYGIQDAMNPWAWSTKDLYLAEGLSRKAGTSRGVQKVAVATKKASLSLRRQVILTTLTGN